MRLTLALCLLPLPALAQTVSLPEGCTGFVTVQGSECSVSHHFTCEADTPGDIRRMDMGANGPTYMGRIDSEAQWMESYHLNSGHAERLEPTPADRASFSELIGEGADSYDFVTLSEEVGETRYAGQDRLTGETVEIDGVTLSRTEYFITAYDAEGNVKWSSSGREFVHPGWRIFLSGQSTYISPNGEFESDNTPVEFAFPGDPGFLAQRPKYNCEATEASWRE